MPEITQDSISEAVAIVSHFSWMDILMAAIVLVAGLVIVHLLTRAFAGILGKAGRLDVSLQRFLTRTARVILYFILIIICAGQLGIPINSLLTILASLGLAISLAVQDTLKNAAGGIFLLSSKPFGTGDDISIGAVSGRVEEIGIIHTALITPENKKVIVPNSKLSGEIVTNHSRMENLRLEWIVSLPPDCDFAKAKEAALLCLSGREDILKTPAPQAMPGEVGASVELIIRAWHTTPKPEGYRGEVRFALYKALTGQGIEVRAIK